MRANKSGIFRDIYNQPYDERTRIKLYTSTRGSLQLIQRMSLLKRLKVHNGCVNSICWNSSGTLILSGSDDLHLVLSNPYNYQVLTDYKTSHRANIFSAKFLPNSGDHRIVSCSGDGIILYTDLLRKTATFQNQFTCHNGTTYQIATIPGESDCFLSCGEDGTVRCFDLRVKEKCRNPRCQEDTIITCQRAITALAVNPLEPYQVAIGCSDSSVRMFDRRMLGKREPAFTDEDETAWPLAHFTVPEFEGNPYRITSLTYSPDGRDVLVSYSSDHLYLFGMKGRKTVQLRKNSSVSRCKKNHPLRSPQPVRRLRLRGDWSDTGPDARPEREGGRRSDTEIAQARPSLHTSLMQRMTDVLSRMLNDPATRAALNGGGDENLEGWIIDPHGEGQQQNPTGSNAEGGERTIEVAGGGPTADFVGILGAVMETNEDSTVRATRDSPESPDESFENCEIPETRRIPNSPEGQPTIHDHRESPDSPEIPNAANVSSNTGEQSTSEEAMIGVTDDDVPMESESSQPEPSKTAITSFTSLRISRDEDDEEPEEAPVLSPETPGDGSMMENLEDRLTTMRDGFLEKHGSEPAVSLTYSDKSSTGSTISLGVANEVIRDNHHPGPSGSQNAGTRVFGGAGPSGGLGRQSNHGTIKEQTDEDVYNDTDEEDADDEQSGGRRRRASSPLSPEVRELAEEVARASVAHNHEDETPLIDYRVKQKYTGHRNARTMIKEANFWGDDFVMSGSDCGHVFVWERNTGKLCMLLEADQHVVNCLQPHPYLPMLATSGIDYDVKLWAPIGEEANFDTSFAEDLQNRNAVMLEETKDTITVPAVFMIRMLACLNQIRRGRGRNRRRSGDEADELRGG